MPKSNKLILSLTGVCLAIAGSVFGPAGLGTPKSAAACGTTVNGQCVIQPVTQSANFALNHVPLSIQVPFLPTTFTTSSPASAIQMASATTTTPYNEISIIVAPYGGPAPATERDLPPAQVGIASTYLQDLQTLRNQQGGTALTPIAATLFGKQAVGISNEVPIDLGSGAPTPLDISEWVTEADNYVWILRVAQQVVNNSLLVDAEQLSAIVLGNDTATPSTSGKAATTSAGSAPGPNIPSPYWWNGSMCDANSYDPATGASATPLFHWGNLTACGPGPDWTKTPDHLVYETDSNGNRVGSVETAEFECVELVERWIWLAYGVPPQPGNGKDMVSSYNGKGNLHAVQNPTPGVAPQPGDVLSLGASTEYGHTAVVSASNVDSSGNGSITVVEQNASRGGTEPLTVQNWKITTTTDGGAVSGWVHSGTVPSGGGTSSYSYQPPPNNACPQGSSSSYYPGDATPGGYWLVGQDGGVFTLGNLSFYGSEGGQKLNAPVIGMARTPSAQGYWLVAEDGGIFSFGNAAFHGSEGGQTLNACAVGMTGTGDGGGYWIVAADGGIFTFGDAGFYGSEGNTRLNAPIVGMTRTPDNRGYWLVGQDGGVFSFGDAQFYGSATGDHSPEPFVSMTATPDGKGYWLMNTNGQFYSFGDAQYYGGVGSDCNCVVAMAATGDGAGYYAIEGDGSIWTFGDAGDYGSVSANFPYVGIAPSP